MTAIDRLFEHTRVHREKDDHIWSAARAEYTDLLGYRHTQSATIKARDLEIAALRAENEALRNEAQADYGTGLALRAELDAMTKERDKWQAVYEKWYAELDAANKAVDEAREVIMALFHSVEYIRRKTTMTVAGEWLTAHPANNAGQDPKEQE